MLLPFVLTAIAIVFGLFVFVKKAASKYFVVDASFDNYDSRHRMSIGGGGDSVCAGCGRPGTKKCSRCKCVRYCSQACQSKHWEEEHKLKCRQVKSSNKLNSDSSGDSAYRRRKSPGFDSISLVPARGSCKVLQEPKKILFPYDEFIKLFNWDKPGFPPCGLLNCGNSCFANVVLQCLACTRPLTAYLLEKDHSSTCIRKREDWCFLCELQTHIQRASQSQQPFSPTNILSRIPNIGGNLGYGSQEDAHEFMRFAIDTMQSVCLDEHGGEKALEPSTQETTLIQYIFGGHLQSQVKCTKCNMISNRYENMMDLTVEIHGDAESLEECLDQFTVKEWLDGDNMYKCDGCNGYVKAWKRLTVHQAPNILTITLKRFQSGRFGKLNKRVTFPEELNLSPYMSEGGDSTDLYSLYAVVVHVDMLNASFFGHYICYTKDYYGHWYRIDDCKVTVVDVDEVLSQGAYMLLYSRRTARREPFVKPMERLKKKQSALNDIDLSNVPNGENVSNDLVDFPSNISSEANSDLANLPSNTSLKSILSLLRDTGHDRHAVVDISKYTNKGIENMESEVNTMLNDLVDVDMKDSELSLLGHEGPKAEENSSQHSNIQEDSVAISQDDTISLLPTTSVEVQDMDCEETLGVTDINFPTKDNSSVSANGDGLYFSTRNMISSLSITEPKSSDASELKPEQMMVEEHYPFGTTNGNDKLPNISCKSKGKTETCSIGKPKPLFSRGFLDKSTRDKKSLDHEKRTLKERQKVSTSTIIANGYANGKSELNNNAANATTHMPFITNGFLNAPCSKSAFEPKASQDNCSALTDAIVCDKDNVTVFTKSTQYQD